MKPTLTIIDTHVIAHLIASQRINPELLKYFVAANVEYLSQGLFLPEGACPDHYTIWVGDKKPYWRDKYFSDLGIFYKGNRRRSPEEQDRVKQTLDFIDQFVEQLGSKVIRLDCKTYQKKYQSYAGFEADDVAGAIVRTCNDLRILLLTCDIDWIGLTHFADKHWLNTISTNNMRVRNASNFVLWFNQWGEAQSAIKNGFKVNGPLDLYKFKCLYKDVSDNLNGFANLSPLPLIDLVNPGYLPETDYKVRSMVQKYAIPQRMDLAKWQQKVQMLSGIIFPFTLDNWDTCGIV